jgi:dTMP kinase
LFVADRLDHLLNKTNGLLKKMEEGFTVITDRYYFSSYAYHSVHNIPMQWVIDANALSQQLLKPDINIYIDIAPEVSMERITKGRSSVDLYETAENLKNVREKYFAAFALLKDKERIVVVNGNRSEEEIAGEIWGEVEKLNVSSGK